MTLLQLNADRKVQWVSPSSCPKNLETLEVFAGRTPPGGMSAIEVAVARYTATGRVPREALSKLHALRVNKRATPVVLVVEMPDDTVIAFGPNAAAEPLAPLPFDQAQRLFQAVLDEPSALMARARLAALTAAIDSTTIPGVKNSGLFANHEIRVGVPQRSDWKSACQSSLSLLVERGSSLISKLGYSVKRAGAHALVLTGDDPRPHAIAVMLDEQEGFDSESTRFAISPVAYGLAMAEREGVPWLIMARGSQLRLYPARVDLGVGRKGLAETFFELDLPYLTVENAGYLRLFFSSHALAEGGTAYQIMESSTQYAVALGERLRDKVYEEIIPDLSLAVVEQMSELGYEMDAEGLDLAYQITLRIFFRLLFQVYAEDRGLLPYKENDRYTRNALKTQAVDFVENPDEEFDRESASLWDDLAQVWNVIDTGDRAWGVPAYNGGLFSSDQELHPHGALISRLRIHNDVMGPVLRALLLDDADDGDAGPIDFRSLSVREFGTIYEGLLESSLGLAEVDLTLDDKGTWLPAKKKSDEVYAYAGQVYFHNTSGQRKGTGSYFTPSLVVEHLLERSLDPALDDHLERVAALIKRGDQAGAADLFFDFKVADLAMGSGHFLTAAIDHIEAKMAAFLAEDGNQIPGVAKELGLLLQAAKDAIGPDAPEPEPSSLLRRQIARRCVYGLDINPIAVELARVSIWIHTFVRGLPMSSLDHNLVCANSLTGIGSVEEALDVLVPGRKGAMTLFDAPIEEALERARTVLVDVANLPELNRKETQAASKAVQKARKEAETAKLLFDAAVLTRIGREGLFAMSEVAAIAEAAAAPEAQQAIAPLQPAHMPVLFPEVFLRSSEGFDVLVGNPPFLSQLRSVGETQTSELAMAKATWPGLVKKYTDQASLFVLRNTDLAGLNGTVALVQPESLLAAADSTGVRQHVLRSFSLSHLWVATRSVFEGASVRTCGPVLRRGLDQTEISRAIDLPPRQVTPIPVNETPSPDSSSWSFLISDLYGVPRTVIQTAGTIGDIASSTADFRDQFYGLSGHVVEGAPGPSTPRLITTGLIDPLQCLWGTRATKFNKVRFEAPVVDMESLSTDAAMYSWAKSRSVVKVLMATQGRTLEALVDFEGSMIPAVPVISIVPTRTEDVWRVAAVLSAPVISSLAANRAMGAGLAGGAIKLSAKQVSGLPLPKDQERWNEAAELIREAHQKATPIDRSTFRAFGELMNSAFSVEGDQVLNWWLDLVAPSGNDGLSARGDDE